MASSICDRVHLKMPCELPFISTIRTMQKRPREFRAFLTFYLQNVVLGFSTEDARGQAILIRSK